MKMMRIDKMENLKIKYEIGEIIVGKDRSFKVTDYNLSHDKSMILYDIIDLCTGEDIHDLFEEDLLTV